MLNTYLIGRYTYSVPTRSTGIRAVRLTNNRLQNLMALDTLPSTMLCMTTVRARTKREAIRLFRAREVRS